MFGVCCDCERDRPVLWIPCLITLYKQARALIAHIRRQLPYTEHLGSRNSFTSWFCVSWHHTNARCSSLFFVNSDERSCSSPFHLFPIHAWLLLMSSSLQTICVLLDVIEQHCQLVFVVDYRKLNQCVSNYHKIIVEIYVSRSLSIPCNPPFAKLRYECWLSYHTNYPCSCGRIKKLGKDILRWWWPSVKVGGTVPMRSLISVRVGYMCVYSSFCLRVLILRVTTKRTGSSHPLCPILNLTICWQGITHTCQVFWTACITWWWWHACLVPFLSSSIGRNVNLTGASFSFRQWQRWPTDNIFIRWHSTGPCLSRASV